MNSIPDIVLNKKLYKIASWQQCFKILGYELIYKNNNLSLFEDWMCYDDKLIQTSKETEETANWIKISPELYIFVSSKYEENERNLKRLFTRLSEDTVRNIQENVYIGHNKDSFKKEGSTKYLIGKINREILSVSEKLYIKINNQFNKVKLLGDIQINEKEEALLYIFMEKQVKRILSGKNIEAGKEKVFAYGLVVEAMRNYTSKRFWKELNQKYNIVIGPNHQNKINSLFEGILRQNNKSYSLLTNSPVQNICMHSFICDKCAAQLFDYIFAFWKIDLNRNVENSIDEEGNNTFDTLYKEITRNIDKPAQDIMLHTTLAMIENPIGAKNRIRRLVELIDKCFWDESVIVSQNNRINRLLIEWKDNKEGVFQKELKSSKKKGDRIKGELLYQSPRIVWKKDNEMYISIPRQKIKDYEEDNEIRWKVEWENNKEIVEPVLQQGKLFVYASPIEIKLPIDDLLNEIRISLLKNEKIVKEYKLNQTSIRFFDAKKRSINEIQDTITTNANTAVISTEEKVEWLNNEGVLEEPLTEKLKIIMFTAEEGDVLILSSGFAFVFGSTVTEGLLGENSLMHAWVEINKEAINITSDYGQIYFTAQEDTLSGILLSIKKDKEPFYNGHIKDSSLKKLRQINYKDNVACCISLNTYIKDNGYYEITLNIKGKEIREYKFLLVKSFGYKFKNAPYIFESEGSIDTNFPITLGEITSKNHIFKICETDKKENREVENGVINGKIKVNNKKYDLKVEVPALYWKTDSKDIWESKQPNSIYLNEIENKLWVKRTPGLENIVLGINPSEDLESQTIEGQYKEETSAFVFPTGQLKAQINKNELERNLTIWVGEQTYTFREIICRSEVLDLSLFADFDKNKLVGKVLIKGVSSYTTEIEYKNKIIADDLEIRNGRFEYEGLLEEGNYTIRIYELEEDDTGFEATAELIEERRILLTDPRTLTGKAMRIKQIGYRNEKIAPLRIKSFEYIIANLKKISFQDYKGDEMDFFSWKYDVCNDEEIKNFHFYKGDFGYINYKKFEKVADCLAIITSEDNPSEPLININDDGEYSPLIYSREKQRLMVNEQNASKAERDRAIEIDDDVFLVEIEVIENEF